MSYVPEDTALGSRHRLPGSAAIEGGQLEDQARGIARVRAGTELGYVPQPDVPHFGRDLDVDLPDGAKQRSSTQYTLRTKWPHEELRTAEVQCKFCKLTWGLHSNLAVRDIARYYLSLSLPFADCTREDCVNHGKNVFEHWTDTRGPTRAYRRESEHAVRCLGCQTVIPLGVARGVKMRTWQTEDRKRPAPAPERVVRRRWRNILDGLYASRSVSDTYDQFDISPVVYYSYLRRISARLRDYHSFRNAALLRPEGPHSDGAVHVYTDVMEVSLQAYRRDRRHSILGVIVSTMMARRKIFVLAAHPYFLPQHLCPGKDERRSEDSLPEWERRWCSVLHPDTPLDPELSDEELEKAEPDDQRKGYFIVPPYAQVAHFLVVQKMLSRFDDIHWYMDGARDMSKAALVALRDRILAGGASVGDSGTHGQRRKSAEIVLYQHDKANRQHVPTESAYRRRTRALETAWSQAEKRFGRKESASDELDLTTDEGQQRVRADLYRQAFQGGYSKDGGWAWLRFPPDMDAYRRCRTLWLTRMPGKSFESHGRAALSRAMLQPVDAIMNSMRARVRAIARPLLRASGRSYRSNYIMPGVVNDELSVYLLRQNYDIRRKSSRQIVPAATWGLRRANEPKLDMFKRAWDFRLGVRHAARISGWLRQ